MASSRGSPRPRDRTRLSYISCTGSSLPLAPPVTPYDVRLCLIYSTQRDFFFERDFKISLDTGTVSIYYFEDVTKCKKSKQG